MKGKVQHIRKIFAKDYYSQKEWDLMKKRIKETKDEGEDYNGVLVQDE